MTIKFLIIGLIAGKKSSLFVVLLAMFPLFSVISKIIDDYVFFVKHGSPPMELIDFVQWKGLSILLILIFLFVVAYVLYKIRIFDEYIAEYFLKLLDKEEDVVYFLSKYIKSRCKYVKDKELEITTNRIKEIMTAVQRKLKLVRLASLESLLSIDIDKIGWDVIITKTESEKIDIDKKGNIDEIYFLIKIARNPSFSSALKKYVEHLKKKSESGNINNFCERFAFFDKKCKVRAGFPFMAIVKGELVRFLVSEAPGIESTIKNSIPIWTDVTQQALVDLFNNYPLNSITIEEVTNLLERLQNNIVNVGNEVNSDKNVRMFMEYFFGWYGRNPNQKPICFFIYGYSRTILNFLRNLASAYYIYDVEIYLIKTEEQGTLDNEEEVMRKEMTKLGLKSSIYSMEGIMTMNFRGKKILFLLGIEMINKRNCSAQHFGAGIRIKKIIDNIRSNQNGDMDIVIFFESYKVFDFNENVGVERSSLLDPADRMYAITDDGFHKFENNEWMKYGMVTKQWEDISPDPNKQKYLSCCEQKWADMMLT